jgi:hypothetical protein
VRLLLSSVILLWAGSATAQICGEIPVTLIVLDRSGSMKSSVGMQSKWSVAQSAVRSMTSQLDQQLAFGLMTFSGDGNCAAGRMKVNPQLGASAQVNVALGGVYPSGNTPIASSLRAAHPLLSASRNANGVPHYVILITDGQETCGGNPVDSAQRLAADGIKTYVVGFGMGVNPASLQAMAQVGGTGRYYQADNPTQLNTALRAIGNQISCCGNGVLDKGEGCDSAIPAGQPGACPTSCDDQDPCTSDQLVGQDCQVKCEHRKTCVDPCGNGVLDTGEICDTGIAPGKAGACPRMSDCNDGDRCTADSIAGKDCQQTCKNQPAPARLEGSDGCCPPGNSSFTDPDCPPPCGPDRTQNCVDLCQGVTCPDRHYCQSGQCVAWPSDPNGSNNGGGNNGSGNCGSGNNSGSGPRAVGGCSMTAVDSNRAPAFVWGFLLFVVLGFARRRR